MNNTDNTSKHKPENKSGGKPDKRRASSSEFTQPSSPANSRPSEPSGWQQPSSQIPNPAPAYPPPPPRKSSPPPRRNSRQPRPNWLLPVGVIVLFGGTLLCGLFAFVVLRFASNARNATSAATQVSAAVTATGATGTPAPTGTIGVDIPAWNGTGRLTILFMGIDKRPTDTGTAFRTDTMIVVSIDPKTKSVGILSIPRDLFVDIPPNTIVGNSYGLQRINSAYTIGELTHAGDGPQLAMQTVQYNLGMRINNYFVFQFTTVINAVDDIGGIDVDVPSAISDPQYPNMYYGYEPLYIPAGNIHMNGDLALKYARTRHMSSDIDREKRQQQIILAMRSKILSVNMFPTLLAQAPSLWSQLSQTTQSDLTLPQFLQLAVYLKDIPTANIHNGIIDYSLADPIVYNGADVLVPQRAKIGPLLVQVFGANYNS